MLWQKVSGREIKPWNSPTPVPLGFLQAHSLKCGPETSTQLRDRRDEWLTNAAMILCHYQALLIFSSQAPHKARFQSWSIITGRLGHKHYWFNLKTEGFPQGNQHSRWPLGWGQQCGPSSMLPSVPQLIPPPRPSAHHPSPHLTQVLISGLWGNEPSKSSQDTKDSNWRMKISSETLSSAPFCLLSFWGRGNWLQNSLPADQDRKDRTGHSREQRVVLTLAHILIQSQQKPNSWSHGS